MTPEIPLTPARQRDIRERGPDEDLRILLGSELRRLLAEYRRAGEEVNLPRLRAAAIAAVGAVFDRLARGIPPDPPDVP